MSMRDELVEIVKDFRVGIADVDAIMTWHTKHQRKVMRKQVEGVLDKHIDHITLKWKAPLGCEVTFGRDEQFTRDVLSLLNGEEETWCEHIEWKDTHDGIKSGWWIDTRPPRYKKIKQLLCDVVKFCPICAKPRPSSSPPESISPPISGICPG